jgi:hypothetical protein
MPKNDSVFRLENDDEVLTVAPNGPLPAKGTVGPNRADTHMKGVGPSFDTDPAKAMLHWLRFRFHHVMIMVMIMMVDDHHVMRSHHVRLSHFLHGHFRILCKSWDS